MTLHAETWKAAAEPFSRVFLSVVETVAARLRLVAAAFRRRRDLAALASLDERMLADIGLTRSDLRAAFSEPLWRDPTAILVNRVERHRRREYRRVTRVVAAPPSVPQAGTAPPWRIV